MLPSPDILNEFEHGRYVLSNLAAKRAKQLRGGAAPLVHTDSNHPLTIALAEIAAGKIKASMPEFKPIEDLPETQTALLLDETVPAELGMLLPALDETEVALVQSDELIHEEEDHEAVITDEEGPLSISDLVVGGEEEEAPVAPVEDDTLSLSDIAEQESSLEDEEQPEI